MQISMKERVRRWLQLRTIQSLTKSLPEGGWWLFGGWALEAITGIAMSHKDIDVGVLDSAMLEAKLSYEPFKKKRYLEIGPLAEENAPIYVIQDKGASRNFVIFAKEGEFIRGYTFLGTILFPRWALEDKPRNLYGIEVCVATPELLYLFASRLPNPRKKEMNTIALLHKLIDHNKLQKMESCFHFQPKGPSFGVSPK